MPRFRLRAIGMFLVLALTLPLVACARHAGPPPPGHESGAFRAIGTEPFWSFVITRTGLRFQTPGDTLGIRIPPVAPSVVGDTLRWAGATERARFDAKLWTADCSDGMSDRVWPLSAIVRMDSVTYHGCGEPLAAPPAIRGMWRVTGHRAPGVSAMSAVEADRWIGTTVEYAGDTAGSSGSGCAVPRYVSQTLSGSDFTSLYRVPPESLGLHAPVRMVEVRCGTTWAGPGGTVIERDSSGLLAPWDGVFFELLRP